MARLPSLLKKYKVDKIISYSQMPPDKSGKILFGWTEKDDLLKDEELILSKPKGKKAGDIILSTKRDYTLYFQSLTGMTPAEVEEKNDDQRLNGLVVNREFLLMIAKLITTGDKFTWDDKTEFYALADKLD